MTIVIIDDDPDDTELFCNCISDIFPTATCIVEHDCENAAGVIAHLDTPPDLIFIDGYMYPVSGIECLVQLKTLLKDDAGTKLIMYSGAVSPRQMLEYKAKGADEVLLKTSSFAEIRQFLSRQFAER